MSVRLPLLTLPLALLIAALGQQPAEQEETALDLGNYRCADHIEVVNAQDGRAEIVLLWAHGYWSALRGVDEKSDPITTAMIEEFRSKVTTSCEAKPGELFITTVRGVR